MLEYLIQLPYEALGQKMLGFLELIDIIQLENAAASQKSQQLLRAILPYCPPIVVSDSWNRVKFNHIVCNWFSNRRCRVQFMKIPIESLSEVNFEPSVLYDITLCLKEKASLKDIALLNDPKIKVKIIKLDIKYKHLHRKFFDYLRSKKIFVNLHYLPIHLQPFYRKFGFKKNQFPVAEEYSETAISIPIYPNLKKKEQITIINYIKLFFNKYA